MSLLIRLVPDAILITLLLLFAWRGATRGLVLTLCSMAALIIAFVGAMFLTRALAPVVAPRLAPAFTAAIEAQFTAEEQPAPDAETPSSPLIGILKQTEWYRELTEAVAQGTEEAISAAANRVGTLLAEGAANIGIFLIAFILLLIVWFIVGHALDLACKLPVLRTFNAAGGGLLGLCKGLLLVYMLAFILGRVPGLLTEQRLEETFLLRHLLSFHPLRLITGGA